MLVIKPLITVFKRNLPGEVTWQYSGYLASWVVGRNLCFKKRVSI